MTTYYTQNAIQLTLLKGFDQWVEHKTLESAKSYCEAHGFDCSTIETIEEF